MNKIIKLNGQIHVITDVYTYLRSGERSTVYSTAPNSEGTQLTFYDSDIERSKELLVLTDEELKSLKDALCK